MCSQVEFGSYGNRKESKMTISDIPENLGPVVKNI